MRARPGNDGDDLQDLPRVLGVFPEPGGDARGGDERPGEVGTLLFVVGGIHGNEPSGVRAIRAVLDELRQRALPVRGRFVGLCGNAAALAQGRRFLEHDLNRLWTAARLEELEREPGTDGAGETREQRELFQVFRAHLAGDWERIALLDLHSTSAGGAPFSIMSDTLQNRPLAFALPVPVLLGLEERVQGTLLSWFADQGHVALCLEGGQNELPSTVDHHVAAIWIALVSTGLLREEDVPRLPAHRARLASAAQELPRVVAVRYRFGIPEGARFDMKSGFRNFQPVQRGEVLARVDAGEGEQEVPAPLSGRLLMPRYQALGDDGFFVGREVRPFWLVLSGWLRRLRLGWLPRCLPGVRRSPEEPGELVVDRRIARWFMAEILHLFGYRWRARSGSQVVFVRRPDRPGRVGARKRSGLRGV